MQFRLDHVTINWLLVVLQKC